MEKKMMRIMGFVGLILVIISLMVIGCSREQAPPPAAAPPAATTPQPAATPPAGTAQTAPAGTPAQDPNQIQVGMTGEQVQQIMGAPGKVKQEGGMTEWEYYTPQGKVEVKLQNNKVSFVERGH